MVVTTAPTSIEEAGVMEPEGEGEAMTTVGTEAVAGGEGEAITTVGAPGEVYGGPGEAGCSPVE